MVKYLHCADLHIGKSRSFPRYLERQASMLDAIYDTAKEKTDGLVLIGGDIYDTPSLYPREKDLFIEKICKADKDGITTVIINGNHDIIDQQDNGYTHLRTLRNLVEKERLQNTYVIEFDPISFYLDKFDLGIIALPALYRTTKQVNLITKTHLKRFRKQYGDRSPCLALIHETIVGAVNESGWPFAEGAELDPSIPVTSFVLGDVHNCQVIQGVPNAWYSGCPIQHDFSDPPRRGVLIQNTSDPLNPEFVRLDHKVQQLETITLSDKDDIKSIVIPENKLVKIKASREQLNQLTLPFNVIKTQPITTVDEKQVSQIIKSVSESSNDVFSGLETILIEMGKRPEDLKIYREKAEKLRG